MTARLALAALLALAASAASAQTPPPDPAAVPTPPAAPHHATVEVAIQTSEGTITLALEKERAPVTTANFLRYVDQKKLDGTSWTVRRSPLGSALEARGGAERGNSIAGWVSFSGWRCRGAL